MGSSPRFLSACLMTTSKIFRFSIPFFILKWIRGLCVCWCTIVRIMLSFHLCHSFLLFSDILSRAFCQFIVKFFYFLDKEGRRLFWDENLWPSRRTNLASVLSCEVGIPMRVLNVWSCVCVLDFWNLGFLDFVWA